MPEAAIRVTGLKKSYNGTPALRGVDLEIAAGEVFALLGPNGAGKTTTVEILEGFRGRDEGDVRVLGHDPARGERDLKERIGIVLQDTGVERFLTVWEVVEMYGGYFRDSLPTGDVIDLVGLADKKDERVYKLSGGQARRLDVAVGLVGDPDLLFLDEPTTGFDPAARRAAWDMVDGLRALGKTIFLTTHYMEEAQRLADRVAIITAGRIVAEGSPSELTAADRATRISFRIPPDVELPPGIDGNVSSGEVSITTDDPVRMLHELTSWAIGSGVALDNLNVTGAGLEDVYLRLTGDGG